MRPTWKKVYRTNGKTEVWPDGKRPDPWMFWKPPEPEATFLRAMERLYCVLNATRECSWVNGPMNEAENTNE